MGMLAGTPRHMPGCPDHDHDLGGPRPLWSVCRRGHGYASIQVDLDHCGVLLVIAQMWALGYCWNTWAIWNKDRCVRVRAVAVRGILGCTRARVELLTIATAILQGPSRAIAHSYSYSAGPESSYCP